MQNIFKFSPDFVGYGDNGVIMNLVELNSLRFGASPLRDFYSYIY